MKQPGFITGFIIGAISILYLQYAFAQEPAFVKYYRTEQDFKSGNALLATERTGSPFLQVTYNDRNLPILMTWLDETGSLIRKEVVSYDSQGSLQSRGDVNDDNQVVNLIRYGEDEPWSREFRKYVYPDQMNFNVTGQQSRFSIPDGDNVKVIEFYTVDGTAYGRIELKYDYLGFLTDERWRTLPGFQQVRRFVYRYQVLSGVQQIWEFDRNGNLISHMALEQAPPDQLYRYPPPRSGNELYESVNIIEDIRKNQVASPIPAFLPRTEWDIMVLSSGDELIIDWIDKTDLGFRFRLPNEEELYTIPLEKVRSIRSRHGDILY